MYEVPTVLSLLQDEEVSATRQQLPTVSHAPRRPLRTSSSWCSTSLSVSASEVRVSLLTCQIGPVVAIRKSSVTRAALTEVRANKAARHGRPDGNTQTNRRPEQGRESVKLCNKTVVPVFTARKVYTSSRWRPVFGTDCQGDRCESKLGNRQNSDVTSRFTYFLTLLPHWSSFWARGNMLEKPSGKCPGCPPGKAYELTFRI